MAQPQRWLWQYLSVDENLELLASFDRALHDRAASTRKQYRARLLQFTAALPEGVTLASVDRDTIRGYLVTMRDAGVSQSTLRARWVALKAFYRWMADEDEVAADPMIGVRVSPPDPPPPSIPDDDDIAALLAACKGKKFPERRDLAMLRVAAVTGIRISELVALDRDDVDLDRRVVTVRHGKGGKHRVCRIDPETASALDRYLRVRGAHQRHGIDALFIAHTGRLTVVGARAMLGRRCDQAGIKRFNMHRFRHRFAHEFLERGGQEGDLGLLGGWSDPSVMRRYGSALATERALDKYDELGPLL